MVSAQAAAPESAPPSDAHVPFDGWRFRRPTTPATGEIGASGLVRYGEDVADEWHHALRGVRGVRVFREMADNDSSVGASLHLIDSHVRQVKWTATPAKDHSQGEEAAEFLTEVMGDMSHTWVDFVSEAFTMLIFGWAWFEKVYKYRQGPRPGDGGARSKYADGKVGIRKVAIRAQETLDGWAFDDKGGLQGMWQRAAPSYDRVLIPIEKSVLFRPKQTKNNPEGKSVLRPAFRSWFFLKRLEELEAIGIERDLVGLPKMELPLEYFAQGASTDKQAAKAGYAKQLSQVRRNEHEGLILPTEETPDGKKTGFRFSLVTTGGTRSLDIGAAVTRHRQSIGQALLTQFIFLGMDKVGTQALSMSLTDLFATSLTVLLDIVEEVWHRHVVEELMELNGYTPDAYPRWTHGDVSKTDIRPLIEGLVGAVDAGLITPDSTLEDFVRKEGRLPEREDEGEGEGGDDPDKNDPPGSLPRSGDDGTQKDGAATVAALVTAIEKLAKIGDVDLCNATRDALAMLLGIPTPKPLTPDDLESLKPQPPLDGEGGPGNPPGKKPTRTPSAKPKP